MSIFPTKILLATDGSSEAQLARTTAIDLANSTNSELHVVTVSPGYPSYDVRSPEVMEALRERAEDILNAQAAKIEREGERWLRSTEDSRAVSRPADRTGCRGHRRGPDRDGKSGAWWGKTSADCQRIGLGGAACPLPGVGGASREGAGGLVARTSRARLARSPMSRARAPNR
jgi:hypothetical protein